MKRNRFVVHEHFATCHHFDFRLEMTESIGGGKTVLKSWAVPKGLPENDKEKRLAVATPDHPISYIDFEGTIPEGVYGAGEVKIWDEGEYELIVRNNTEYKFTLFGNKLTGSFALFHPKTFGKDQYLFIKHKE